MRRRNYSGYTSRYRHRRLNFGVLLRVALFALLVGVIGFSATMVYRAFRSETVIADLRRRKMKNCNRRLTAMPPSCQTRN